MASQKGALDKKELKRFADLLMLLREEFSSEFDKKIPGWLSRLDDPKNSHTAQSLKTANTLIADIDVYLQSEKDALITPNPYTETHRTKPNKKNKSARQDEDRPIHKRLWIRDYLADLEQCFVVPGKEKNGRAVLYHLTDWQVDYTVYFWQWTEHSVKTREQEGKLKGEVREGKLTILGRWQYARLTYTEDGKQVYYEGEITLRRNGHYKTYFLTLHQQEAVADDDDTSNQAGKRKRPSKRKRLVLSANQLNITFCIWKNNPDTMLTGTFSGADIKHGYPLMGQIQIVRQDELTKRQDDTPTNSDDIATYLRNQAAFKTYPIRLGSSGTVEQLPNFYEWRDHRKLFDQPLHGYFLKEVDEKFRDFKLVHFTLTVDFSDTAQTTCQATIEYEGSNLKDVGYITIERPIEHGIILFRGEFDFNPVLDRFRFRLDFTKPDGGNWYFGTVQGLNRTLNKQLVSSCALRKTALSLYDDEKNQIPVGEILQLHPTLADFLLEVNQHIPTKAVPFYRSLGWPHLPFQHPTASPSKFKKVLSGDYACYSLIRQKAPAPTNGTKTNNGAGKIIDKYLIARYPVRILPDGRAIMKYESTTHRNGSKTEIIYHGRAFHNANASRLYLYFDTREEGEHIEWLHLSMYFGIRQESAITRAFGVSSRFVHTESFPEARVEVLTALTDSDYDNTDYQTYDPLTAGDIETLNKQAVGLGRYLAGRANRMLLLSSRLYANDDHPIPPRKDMFRQLHIRAALYEIEHNGDDQVCIDLLNDAYMHGFGSEEEDISYLKQAILRENTADSLQGRRTILTTIKQLWPDALPKKLDIVS